MKKMLSTTKAPLTIKSTLRSINSEKGKKEFVETVKSLGIAYKKADPKMKRAYAALRRKL